MSVRLLILTALAVAAAALLAASASALPCQTCDRRPRPTARTRRSSPRERVTHTLTVETARGRVTDGAALDCPGGACTRKITYVRRCTDGDCPSTPTRSSP